jgi:hypothetical protein
MNRGSRFLASVALPLALILGTPAVALAQEPMERAQELYNEGSSLYSAADYSGAIERFTAALQIVTKVGSDQEHTIRGALLLNIAQSHIHAYEVDADIGHLRTARSIYKRFVDEAFRGAGYEATDVKSANEQHDVLDAQIKEIEAQEKQAAANQPAPNNPAPPTSDTGGNEAEIVRTRSIGIGLLVGGVAVAVAGAGFIIWGSTYRDFAIQSVQEEAGDPAYQLEDFTPKERAHVDQQTRFGSITMGAGGGALAIGVVGVALGAWQLAKANKMKAASSASLVPVLNRGYAGFSLSGRF